MFLAFMQIKHQEEKINLMKQGREPLTNWSERLLQHEAAATMMKEFINWIIASRRLES